MNPEQMLLTLAHSARTSDEAMEKFAYISALWSLAGITLPQQERKAA